MFKIMTFNVRIDVPVDKENNWKYRVDSIAEYIKREQPLILGIQEANQSMMEDLMPRLPMYGSIGEARDNGGERSAILYLKSETEPIWEKTIWLSHTPDIPSNEPDSHFPRIATFGLFEISGKQYCFINTHLDYAGEATARRQLGVILRKTSQIDYPLVMMGDFNVFPDSSLHRELSMKEWILPYSRETLSRPTYHDFGKISQGKPIDYIYLHGSINSDYAEVDETTGPPHCLSDHYPVKLRIE